MKPLQNIAVLFVVVVLPCLCAAPTPTPTPVPTVSPPAPPSARQRIRTIEDYIVYYSKGPGDEPGPAERTAEREAILDQWVAAGTLPFMWNWNAYLWPMVVITSIDPRTLPIILTWYSTQHTTRPHITMAATVMIVIPILIVYFFQRWIVRGIALTGFK